MKSFEIKITGNAKSLVDSIKSSQSAMDALIKGIDKADKKLEVLTQTGSHLSNIDKQLAKLKTDYPDIFEKIFPNIDSQINESMKPILQMPELVEQTMTKVAQKMKAIDSGTLKATDDDIKELGNDMRILGETLHLENLDMSFLDGTAKAETKIKRLIDTMGKLVEAYFNVNRAAANVDVGNVAQKKNVLKKSKGNIKTSPVDDEENVKKELSELEKYQQILKVINGEDIKLKTTKKDDLEQLKLLVAQFDEATNAVKRFEAAKDTNSDKYKEALAEQYRLAVLLKNTMDDVADNGSEKAVNFISSQTEKFGAYSRAEDLIKKGFGPNLTKDIGEIFTKKIEKASFSYDRLTESVERFYEILQKVNNDDNLTDEETDALYEEAEKIKNTFASLDIRTKDFFEKLSLGVINTKEVIQELTKMLGIELPAAMDKPEEKIQKLLPTSEGLEKLRIIPDGDQKARISEYAEEYRVILKLLQQGNIESKETISALRERARTLKNIIQGVNPGDTTLDKLLTDGYGISKGTANTVASAKLSSKFQIDEFKSENISNDARQEAINLIHQEIVAENQLAQKKKEELEDAKIKAKENEEARIAAEAEAKAAKEAAEAARLQAEEKEKARLAAEAEAKLAHSQSNVSSNNKILLYRYGRTDFSDKDFAYSDTMGEIVDSLKIGFGGFGDGMYSVVGSAVSDIVQSMTKPTDSNHDYFEIDASKYKLFINQTEEEAERLQSFLMNLQKFVLSAGDFRGFDDDIANIDNNSLFNEAKSIFKQFDMKQDEFNSWIQQMKQIVVDNKLDSNGKFNTEDAEFLKSHNFGTRFMQKLGYEGIVNKTGNVEFDGMAQGSVIFDPNYEEIIKYLEETGNKSKWAADLLKLFKQEAVEATSSTENGGAAGSSFEWLNDGIEKAKRTLEEFRLLQNEILGKSATAEGGSMDGEAIGRYTERVEAAKAKLDELAKQSLLTADQIKEANDIYETAIGNLEDKSRTNKEHYDNLSENTGSEPAGSYDSGYDRGYYDARSDADSELDNLQKQLNEAEAELNRAKASIDSGTPIDTSVELQSLEKLRAKLEEVKNAIIAKNKAFNDEGTIVGQVVGKEINALSILLTRINDVSDAITQLINNINSSSEISTGLSNVNINVNGKVGEGSSSVDVSSITSAIKEAIYSKDITKAGYTKLTDFNQAFDIKYDLDTEDIQYITSKLNGEIFDTIEEAMAEFNRSYKDLFINKNDYLDILSKEDLFSKIENNSNNDDWARVVVDAINTQGNNIVQALKIIPSQNASDTINEAELIKAFQIVAQSVAHDINPRDFFQGIIDGTIVPEQNLAQAMQTLGMLSNDLKATFSLADTGMRNLGVAIAENIVIPSRPASLDETKELAPLLDKAVDLGAAVPRILSSFNDAEKVIELQTRMPGTNLRSSKFNPEDLINATDKQIDGLLNTLEALSKVGLFPDFTGDNILFDKNKGFSLVDVGSKFEGWMHGNVDTFEGMVEYLKDYIYQLASDNPFDGSKATLSEEQAELFNRRLSNRAALAPEDRLVNFDTIRAQNEVQKGEGVNVKITPIMDEGAIAQVVTENVANTPVTVKINPEIDNQDSTDKGNQIPQQKAAYDSINNLEGAIDSTTSAINDKTQAFDNELETVQRVIQQEIQELDNLLNKINDVTGAVNANAEAFQAEGNAVSESVKQAAKIKEETKKKDTFDTYKENLISVVSEYEKSLSDVQFIPDDALNKVSEMQAKLKDITNSNDLAKWKSEWNLLTESIESARKEQEELIFEKQKNQLTGIKNTLSNSYKSAKIDATNVPEELQEVKTGYEDIVARINTCIKQRKILTEEEVTGFAKEAATIKQVLDAYTEKTKVQTKNSSAYGSAFVKNATNKYDRLYSIATNDEFGVSPAVVTKAQELKSVYEQIVSLNKSFTNTNPSEEQRIAFNRLTDEFNETYSALDKIIKSSRKLAQNGSNIFELYNDGKIEFDLSSEEGRMTALKEAVNFMSDGKAQIGEFNRECTALNYTVKNSDGTFTEFTARINEAGTAIVETTGKTQKSTTMFGRFFDELKRKARGIATYLISITSFQSVWQEIRQGITYIKEIDSALTELKKVTNETDETYEKFLDTASKVGSEIGSTIADFTDATADFARLGYSISEATKLAEAASIYKNVGDGIDSVSQATESIISTMKAFGIEADNSMAIVDKFNEVGNNFAISSTGIGEALQRSASALYESGNTLDESIGLITAANSVIQNPEQVGTALKTLSLRLRGAKVELEEAGEDVDGMADSVSSLQQKLLALTHGKVDIMADASTFKNTTQILREMSKAWEDMTDIERSAALELMGGKRQANILASIIKNYDTVDSVIEASINSQNSAYEENLKWMDSIEGRINKFTNTLQSMWKNAINSDAVKNIISFGTAIVELIDKVGLLPSILTAASAALSAFKGQNLFFNLNKDSSGKLGIITELIQKVKEGVPALKEFNSIQGVENQAKFLNSLKETNPELAKYITKIMSASSATTANGVATNIASASQAGYTKSLIASKIATIALKVATVALNAALTMGISLLVSVLITAVSKWINKTKEEKEETKNLTEELKKQESQIKSNISSLESLKDEFNELSKGVDEYGNNISLSTEEYEKYKSIVEEILGYTKTLISGYDEEGNAIANKNNLIEKSIELLKEERKQKLLDLVTDDKLKVAYSSSKESYDKAEEGLIDVYMPSTLTYSGVKIDDNGEEHGGYIHQIDKYIEDVIGIEKNASESITEYITRNYDAVRNNIGKIIERSGQTKDGWKGLNEKQQTELLSYLNNVLSGVREADSAWDSFIQTLQLVPQISTYYDKLSDSQKRFIASYINGIDDLENKTEEEVSSIKNGILSLTNAIGSDKEAQSLIDQLFSIDSNLSAKEYSDKISEIFNKLIEKGTISNDDKQKIIDQLFPDLKDIEIMQTKVKEKVKDGQKDLVNSLNAQDLKIAYSIDVSNVSFDELKKSIQDVKVANIGDFNISDYSDSISSLSENIGVLQAALEKLNSGQFTMDDYVKLIKDFPKLAKGVDVSSKSFKGLTSNLVRAIKASPKSMVKDLKALKLQLMQTGRSTSDIDQLIYSLEHMPEDALDSMITKYSTLADTITEATEAQNELKAAMEENPNEGFETRGEAMDYMKEAMSRGEIGSESNLWNVAEKYGFTFDSAKSINENADALAKFIATREKWFKQDDDGNYTYEGTKDFIKKVDAAVASMPELQELMKWDYNESTGVLDFDFKNKDWDQIVKYLSTCEGLIGLTSDEWADMLVQVGQYFNIDWSNYNDELEYLKKITTEDTDNKTKVEKYGSAMQEYFGKDSSIDLANRPMVSSSKMKAKGWDVEDGSYATVFSGSYSNEGETAAITVTPILPDGEILTEEELTKYATEIVNGADPATYEFEVNGKTYTGEDIILAKHNGKDPIEEAKEYGQALHEAQEEYDKLRDTLNINTTIDEKGIEGLSEIKEIQSAIQKNADGTTIIDEQAFRKALTSAEYTEDQVNLIIDKIKSLNSEVFASDTFNLNKIFTTVSTTPVIDQLLEIQELQGAIKKDAKTGLAVIDTDMFTSVLSEAGYTKTQIDELIQKIQEYENVVSVAGNTDPLGLNGASLSIDALKASLSTLGVSFDDTFGTWFDGKRDLEINVPDLVSTLKEKGWTEEAIRSYCEQLSKTNIEGFNIKVNSQEIDEALAKSDDVPEEKTTNYEVTGEGATTLAGIDNTWTEVTKDKTTNYTIYETTVKELKDKTKFNLFDPSTWADGSANVSGTANAQGNWGIPEDETSLVGELGPELLVRNGKWTTIGENGAEFTDVKKGDIIFNHKQTEELLKNGHITGRGKAYANGTAYLEGGGTYARYGFSGNGGYTKYDVNNSIVDSFGNAADSISDAADKFEEVFDWFEVLLEEIEDNISLMNAKLENAVGISAKKGIYSEIINTEQFKLQELYEGIKLYSDYANKLLAKVPDKYKEMAQNGAVAITDFLGEANEEVIDSINNYREWAKKVSDLNQQIEETKKTIHDTHVEAQNMIKDEYDNRISLITATNDRIQETIDLLDEEGKRSSAVMYEEMIKNSTKQLSELQNKRAEMQNKLDEAVSLGPVNGVEKYSSQWYEMVNAISDVDSEINDCKVALEGFQNSINQLHWDNFEKFIDAIDNVGTEISNLGDLIEEEDVVDEIGNWTKKGITALGLYAQEMERAKYRAEQYGKEIEYLNQEYAAGKYSVDEYNEKLQELKDGQWDSIKSYEAAKKSIIDLNKTRVDAIKDGIQKEIDAYSELIDKKKEELSLQKDAHDFSKQVAEQQKNVADLQKKLAVMAGDNSASAIAQKKKLQAELSAAQQELEELYYNHSVEKQQEALDKSLENYQDNKQDEMDALDESLKNEEQVIYDSYATIAANTESVAQTLAEIASQYGITLSDSVTKPWLDGANAIGTYQEQLDTSMSSFTQQLEALKKMYADLQAQADSTGRSMVDAINSNKSKTESATYTPPQSTQPSTPSQPSKPSAPSAGASVTVKKSATNFSRDGGNGTRMQSWVPGSTFTVYQVSGSEVLIGRNGGYTGWVRLSDIEGYAKGTKGVTNDQLAMLDELGEELVLHAGKDGKLQFLTKGTSVIPSDITENLMKLGSLDPRQVLDNNRPSIGAPHIINNNMEINMEIAEVVHIDHADNSSIPDITKAVQKQMDAYMKNINQGLKRYTR